MDSEPIPEEVIVEPVVEPVPPIDPNQRIIYPTPEGGVAIIIPGCDCGLTIEQVAAIPIVAQAIYEGLDKALK